MPNRKNGLLPNTPSSIPYRRNPCRFRKRMDRLQFIIHYLEKSVHRLHQETKPWLTLLPVVYQGYYQQTREPLALLHFIMFNIHHQYAESLDFLKHTLSHYPLYSVINTTDFFFTATALEKAIHTDEVDLEDFFQTLSTHPIATESTQAAISKPATLTQHQVIYFFRKRMGPNDPLQRRETQIDFNLH
jgi:hypothetical protein